MTSRNKTQLQIVQPDLDQMEAVVVDAAKQVAPMTSRHVAALNDIQMKVNTLSRERGDFEDRRSLLKAQYEAADAGLKAQIADIDATLGLFPQIQPTETGEA